MINHERYEFPITGLHHIKIILIYLWILLYKNFFFKIFLVTDFSLWKIIKWMLTWGENRISNSFWNGPKHTPATVCFIQSNILGIED